MKYLKEYNEYSNDKVFYHGSNIKLDNIRLMSKTSGESRFLGDGIYITNSKEIAESYGEYTYSLSLSEPLNTLQYFDDLANK